MGKNVKFIRSIATFTLDYGKCPPWLFERMVRLSRIIAIAIVEEFGAEEFLKRLADPVWFQSFGCLLAFDWNASGLTTTTLGALKVAISGLEKDLGLFICGGKGKTSRKTPDEILTWSDRLGFSQEQADNYVKASKLAAKVDNVLIQDGFSLYHHTFIFTKSGDWAVIQQGMNTKIHRARRYHWYSKHLKDFTSSPHVGIQSTIKLPKVFNLVLEEASENKRGILELVKDRKGLFYEIKRLQNLGEGVQLNLLTLSEEDFTFHPVERAVFTKGDLDKYFKDKRVLQAIDKAASTEVKKMDDLLLVYGVGPKTIRALSLVSELIYGARPSFEDPVRYTYAFGGKDGIPYPVNRQRYDKIIEVLQRAIRRSKLLPSEKDSSLRRVEKLFNL